jgi:molybdopterin converting factor small subunit
MACVRFWAGARAVAGVPEQNVDGTTLCGVLDALRAEHGAAIAKLLDVSVILVDGDQVGRHRDRPLAATATVEILPPYAGG